MDRVTANSIATRDALAQISMGSSQIVHIPIGISEHRPDRSRCQKLRLRLRRNDGPLIVFVGRLIEEKGISDLLTAISMLRDVLPDLTAAIVGDGPDRTRFEKEASTLKVTHQVTFVGQVSPSDVQDFLEAADIFVGPSKTSSQGGVEAQGLAIVEAMLAGKPVITTATGGIVDAVQDGITGLLVAESAPRQIANAIVRLASDPSLRELLGRNGSKAAQDSFSRRVTAAAFSRVFQQLHRR